MCKLFSITNTKKIDFETLERITKQVQSDMTSERDGFGIMSKNKNNSVSIRRFLKPNHATLKSLKQYSFQKKTSESIGDFKSTISICFHGRTSTNDVNLINTHPISKHGLHLIHNGVVQDSGPKYKMVTTNDTEHLVERLSQGIESIEKYISGFYATISYNDTDDTMTIIKDNIAPLLFCYIDELETYMFASTESQLSNVLKLLKTESKIYDLEDNLMLVFDSNSNLIKETKITPLGRSSYADSLIHKSLNYLELKSPQWNDDFFEYDRKYTTKNDNDSDLVDIFLETIPYISYDWIILGPKGEIDIDDFLMLSEREQLKCTLVDERGVIVSVDESTNGKLYSETRVS